MEMKGRINAYQQHINPDIHEGVALEIHLKNHRGIVTIINRAKFI